MRKRTIAERAAFIPAVIGPVVGALFLFAPIQGYCISTVGSSVTTCGWEALWQRQLIFPLPFLAVLVWSLAPAIVYYGVRLRVRGRRALGARLMVAGTVLATTCIISFGAGPYFFPLVAIPTLITTIIACKTS